MENNEKLRVIFDKLSEKPIAYHPIYTRITGSLTAGILLSQLVYWAKTMSWKEFYKTNEDICKEVSISEGELRLAKKKLQKLNFVNIKIKDIPAKTYYFIDIDKMIESLCFNEFSPTSTVETTQLATQKQRNLYRRNNETLIENNTKNNIEGVVESVENHQFNATPTPDSFDSTQAIEKLLNSDKLHEQIIGMFFDHRGDKFRSQDFFNLELRKNVRAASMLAKEFSEYEDKLFYNLFEYTSEMLNQGKKITDIIPTLETVLKYVSGFKISRDLQDPIDPDEVA